MTVSFKTDILPLFTSMDIEHMSNAGVLLDEYAYMSQPANAKSVYDTVSTGTMPPGDSGEHPGPRTRSSCSKRGWTAATSRSPSGHA
jgi:hypothetical protein